MGCLVRIDNAKTEKGTIVGRCVVHLQACRKRMYLSVIIVRFHLVAANDDVFVRWHSIVPSLGVTLPWIITLFSLLIWCIFHFIIVGPERLDVPISVWRKMMFELQQEHYHLAKDATAIMMPNTTVTATTELATEIKSYGAIPTPSAYESTDTLRRREVTHEGQDEQLRTTSKENAVTAFAHSMGERKVDDIRNELSSESLNIVKNKIFSEFSHQEQIDPKELDAIRVELRARRQKVRWSKVVD